MSTSRHGRRGYHHGGLAGVLLRTAAQLIEKEGVEALSLREVARRAGVSHSAPYRHFQDREALLAALAADGFERLGQAQRKAAAAGALRALGEAYLQFALAHPQRFRLMFDGRVPIEKHPELRDVAMRTFDGLAGALAARVPGAPGAGDASLAAWALVHGFAQLLLGRQIPEGARRGRGDAAFAHDVLACVRFAAGPAQAPA
jgi:AcrR family transcriptional regulator